MRDARKYQIGPRAAEAHLQLERLAAASACLLDPEQKVAYDNRLREQFGLPPVAVRSQYIPRTTSGNLTEIDGETVRPSRLSPRVALILVILAGAAAILVGQRCLEYLFLSQMMQKAAAPPGAHAPPLVARGPAGLPHQPQIGGPPVINLPPPSTEPVVPKPGVEGNSASRIVDAPVVDPAVGAGAPTPTAINTGIPPAATPADRQRPVDRRPTLPPAPLPKQDPLPIAALPRPAAVPGQDLPLEMNLSSTEVLRQLREFRLRRSPAMRMSMNPESLGAQRVVDLVNYGRSKFADDRRFQRQLDQEVSALRRLYAPFRNHLPDPEN
jgi:hypothetical protein